MSLITKTFGKIRQDIDRTDNAKVFTEVIYQKHFSGGEADGQKFNAMLKAGVPTIERRVSEIQQEALNKKPNISQNDLLFPKDSKEIAYTRHREAIHYVAGICREINTLTTDISSLKDAAVEFTSGYTKIIMNSLLKIYKGQYDAEKSHQLAAILPKIDAEKALTEGIIIEDLSHEECVDAKVKLKNAGIRCYIYNKYCYNTACELDKLSQKDLNDKLLNAEEQVKHKKLWLYRTMFSTEHIFGSDSESNLKFNWWYRALTITLICVCSFLSIVLSTSIPYYQEHLFMLMPMCAMALVALFLLLKLHYTIYATYLSHIIKREKAECIELYNSKFAIDKSMRMCYKQFMSGFYQICAQSRQTQTVFTEQLNIAQSKLLDINKYATSFLPEYLHLTLLEKMDELLASGSATDYKTALWQAKQQDIAQTYEQRRLDEMRRSNQQKEQMAFEQMKRDAYYKQQHLETMQKVAETKKMLAEYQQKQTEYAQKQAEASEQAAKSAQKQAEAVQEMLRRSDDPYYQDKWFKNK